MGKEPKKEWSYMCVCMCMCIHIYIYISDPFCCTAETNTTL